MKRYQMIEQQKGTSNENVSIVNLSTRSTHGLHLFRHGQDYGQAARRHKHSHFLNTVFVLEPLSACYRLRAMLKVLLGRFALSSLGAFLADRNSRLQHMLHHFQEISFQGDTVGGKARDR
jgi:hypothetical protein